MLLGSIMGQMYNTWLKSQVLLLRVERWENYRGLNPKLRRQSTLQHQYSVCLVIIPVLLKLKIWNPSLDTELVKDAFMIHDIAEGLLKMKQDVVYGKKQNYHDVAEYLAFHYHFENLKHDDYEIYQNLEKAYLLQFAGKSTEHMKDFPDQAAYVMNCLKESNPLEVLLFPALERWEYLFYAYEGYKEKGDKVIFVNVLRNQIPRLIENVKVINGFREVVFPQQLENELTLFMKENEDIPRC